jgi:hypothetical protein
MPVSQPTIHRLLRENFTGENPMLIPEPNRETLGEQIRQRIANQKDVTIDRHSSMSDDEKTSLICMFTLKDKTAWHYYSHDDFLLITNELGQLTIKHDEASFIVSSIEEILVFISAYDEQVERQFALKNRREKVRDLKAQAIVAKVKNIAREDKFEFNFNADSVKLELYVKLSNGQYAEIHIPFKTYQDVLPCLREMIASFRNVGEYGVKFKIKSNFYGRWITPDS